MVTTIIFYDRKDVARRLEEHIQVLGNPYRVTKELVGPRVEGEYTTTIYREDGVRVASVSSQLRHFGKLEETEPFPTVVKGSAVLGLERRAARSMLRGLDIVLEEGKVWLVNW